MQNTAELLKKKQTVIIWLIELYYLGLASMRRAETMYSWSISIQSKMHLFKQITTDFLYTRNTYAVRDHLFGGGE